MYSTRPLLALFLTIVTSAPALATAQDATSVCTQFAQITLRAEGGEPQAEATLGQLNHDGLCGLSKDDVKAMKWASLAANQGNADGENLMALLLNRGWGTTRNDVEAIRWARLSAEQGNIAGQDYLALMLHHGWGTQKNDIEAMKWARLSAEQNDPQGEGLLALILAEEPAAPKDDVEAVRWARLSAEQGHNGGQFVLGVMYSMGRGGLAKDYVEADKWYLLCGQHANSVTKARNLLEASMSKEDIAEAKRRASEWAPTPKAWKK